MRSHLRLRSFVFTALLASAGLFAGACADEEPVPGDGDVASDAAADTTSDASTADTGDTSASSDTADDTTTEDAAPDADPEDTTPGDATTDTAPDAPVEDAGDDTAPDAEIEDADDDAEPDVPVEDAGSDADPDVPTEDTGDDTDDDTGIPVTCPELIAAIEAELYGVRECTQSEQCGQVMTGTSCGCTRELVARIDADLSRFEALRDAISAQSCDWGLSSTCDCPEADGYACVGVRCTWNYR